MGESGNSSTDLPDSSRKLGGLEKESPNSLEKLGDLVKELPNSPSELGNFFFPTTQLRGEVAERRATLHAADDAQHA